VGGGGGGAGGGWVGERTGRSCARVISRCESMRGVLGVSLSPTADGDAGISCIVHIKCAVTPSYAWHDSYMLTCMTHTYACYDLFICVVWLIHMWDMIQSDVWHNSFICVIWLIYSGDMTHSNVWHDSFVCATWLIDLWDKTHLIRDTIHSEWIESHSNLLLHIFQVWHDPLICVTWLIYTSHIYHVWHDSFIRVTCFIHRCEIAHHICDMHHIYSDTGISCLISSSVTRLIHICDMTRTCAWHDLYIWVTWFIHMRD